MTDQGLPSWSDLELMPGTSFYRLYRSPPSALAVFRKRLSRLAKSFVMTLLYLPGPMAARDLQLMVRPSGTREYQHAIDLLHRYHIVKDVTYRSGQAYALTPDFAKSLRSALVGVSGGNPFGEIANVAGKHVVPLSDLDEFARRRWEGILGYMVGSTTSAADSDEKLPMPTDRVIEFLKAGQLIELHRGIPQITKEGFAFVLQDVNTQIWALLFLHVEHSDLFSMDKVEVLSNIFLIASLELGSVYSLSHMTELQRTFLASLDALGIVYLPQGQDSKYFYPTRLATSLTSDSSATLATTNATLGTSLAPSAGKGGASAGAADRSETNQGFIIVETNYRIYAYTNSPLQIALLSLFVTLRSRHPNLVTGKMTKLSVQRAIHSGITAEQIISYLSTHAHPQMRRHAQAEKAKNTDGTKVVSLLPATVLDQIHLWQIERDRMTTTSGFLMKDWSTQAEYERVCKHADDTGVLVWKSDKKRMFFVTSVKGIQGFLADRNR